MNNFIKYFNSNKFLLNHILDFEPNIIAIYLSGSVNTPFVTESSDINITCIVYKYPKYFRLPEYYEFNGKKININCISIDYFLNYNNIHEPLYTELASEEQKTWHYNMVEFLLFNFVSKDKILYISDKFKDLFDYIYNKRDELARISLDNLMYMKDERISDIIDNTKKYSKYKYIYMILYTADKLIFTDELKDNDFYLDIKNSKEYIDIKEYNVFVNKVKKIKAYFDTNILELELRNDIKTEFNLLGENICFKHNIVITHLFNPVMLNFDICRIDFLGDINGLKMYGYVHFANVAAVFNDNVKIYLVNSQKYLNEKCYRRFRKYHIFDNGTYRLRSLPWEEPEPYQFVTFDDDGNIVSKSDILTYE